MAQRMAGWCYISHCLCIVIVLIVPLGDMMTVFTFYVLIIMERMALVAVAERHLSGSILLCWFVAAKPSRPTYCNECHLIKITEKVIKDQSQKLVIKWSGSKLKDHTCDLRSWSKFRWSKITSNTGYQGSRQIRLLKSETVSDSSTLHHLVFSLPGVSFVRNQGRNLGTVKYLWWTVN